LLIDCRLNASQARFPHSWQIYVGTVAQACPERSRRGCPVERISTGARRRANLGLIIKYKRAAQGRRSGNHCGRHKILGRFQGTPGLECIDWSRGGVFAFYSPFKILLRRERFVKRERKNFTAKIAE
jgi:hypothetical protein